MQCGADTSRGVVLLRSTGDAPCLLGRTWGYDQSSVWVSDGVGVGITSLPSVRSTEGQFPYWLGVDDRLIADEFFRGSYTSGVWLKGELHTKVKYHAMFANNLSTLGVSASQLDNKLDTQSYSVQWLPTTGEFGLYGTAYPMPVGANGPVLHINLEVNVQ